MASSKGLQVGLAIAAIVAVVLWGATQRKLGAEQALSQARSDSLGRVTARYDALRDRHLSDSTRYTRDSARQAGRALREKRRADSLRATLATIRPRVDTILATLPPETRAPIDSALSTLEGENVACRAALFALDTLSTGCALRLRDANKLLMASDSLLTATQHAYQIERKRRECHIGPLPCPSRGLMFFGGLTAGVLAGIAAK